jgi:uncharacterized protein YndB with AHSA1/START domain
MRIVKYTSRFRRDYKREKSGRHGKRIDAELLETVNIWRRTSRCPGGISITRSAASGTITATATSGPISSRSIANDPTGVCRGAPRRAAESAALFRPTLAWTFTPTSTGTHLRMEQSGFRPDQQQAYQGAHYGWQQVFAKLEQVLARLD